MPRFFCADTTLAAQATLTLPPAAARHVQVLRLQPGAPVTLFDGHGGEWDATVTRMGRSDVEVQLGAHHALEREAPRAVRLALGMPANERMDWLVEKATELGVAAVQPLLSAHAVLRVAGERADKKVAHWQAVAVAACEQCGRNRVPPVQPVATLAAWLAALPPAQASEHRVVLGFGATARPLAALARAAPPDAAFTVLSGPEGGLSAAEIEAAQAHGFALASLGPRVLRAETAPLAALMALLPPGT